MTPPAVRTDRNGTRAVVEVAGDIDVATSEDLRALLGSTVDGGVTSLIINMIDVTYLDSTGLSCFIGTFNKLRETGGTMTLVVTSPQVLKILQITGMTNVFQIVATEAEALAE